MLRWNFSSNQAGALLNYLLVKEDRSGGVHNYRYIKALLKKVSRICEPENSVEAG